MRSIRLSLIVYFLLLLAAALGGVAWFVYESSTEMLRKSGDSKRRLLEQQYTQRVKEAKTALDTPLVKRARTLAKLSRWSHDHLESLFPLGVLGSALQPQGHLQTLLWLGEAYHRPLAFKLWGYTPFEISMEMAEDMLPHPGEGQSVEYFQINGPDGRVLERSESLGDHFLPLTTSARDVDFFKESYDDVLLRPGVRLRMVTIKGLPKFRPSVFPEPPPFRWPPRQFGKTAPPDLRPRRGNPGPDLRARRNNPDGFVGPGPMVYIQCATGTGPHEAILTGYRDDLENELAKVNTESGDALAALRTRLLWISCITFFALAVGGFWLVRLGLLPLARVSEAVSRVSEKDFRLQMDDRHLPSELQPIVERLKQTLDQLRRAFSREKQAAADFSHELRTPLAALLTTLDVGLRKPRSAEEYRELLLECRAAGRQMTHLVERLLALARLDAGVDHLRPREVDAAAVAEECAAMVRPLAEARDVTLHVHDTGPARVRTDPDKLREILTNLLHNAIQYNRPHGAIEVAVQRQNGDLDLEVQDTGIGIAPDVKDQIFERFYRADKSRHADDLHAGLGLAIVKGYVDLMGGTIAVDSTVGQGSTFRVRLPSGMAPREVVTG